MDGSSERRAPEQRPYLRIGFGLLALVVLLLVAAFVLSNQLRPHVGIAPASGATRTPTPRRISGTRSTPAVRSTATVPAPTTTPATVTPTVRPTPASGTREAVMQAYHRYWQVYSQALYTLDTSHVGQVAAGNELHRIQAEVAGFRKSNDAVHVRVRHHALIVAIKGDSATIYDEQHDSSWAIDPVTKEPFQGPRRDHLEKDIHFMKRMHGVWKVIKSLRQEG